MSCPLLGATRPACRAVEGAPLVVDRDIVAAYCRGDHETCPAFRVLRATGRRVHPADFGAWVVRGVQPGRADAERDAATGPDGP